MLLGALGPIPLLSFRLIVYCPLFSFTHIMLHFLSSLFASDTIIIFLHFHLLYYIFLLYGLIKIGIICEIIMV